MQIKITLKGKPEKRFHPQDCFLLFRNTLVLSMVVDISAGNYETTT